MSTLYSATLLDHFRHPRNFGDLPAADVMQESLNPLCGDRIRIALKLSGDTIEVARFRGDACAICIAATSLLTEMLPRRTLADAAALGLDDLLPQLQAEIPAGRMKCALLPLDALGAGLRAYHQAND